MKKGTHIRVHGFVMLKGLDAGDYVVCEVDDISYSFRKPKGKKVVCRHYKNSVEGPIKCFERGDSNGIEILK